MSNDGLPASNQPVLPPDTKSVYPVRQPDAIRPTRPGSDQERDRRPERPALPRKKPHPGDPVGQNIDEIA